MNLLCVTIFFLKFLHTLLMCLEIDLHQVMKFVCCVHVQNNVQYFHLNYILYSYVSYEENVLSNNL